MSAPCRCLWSLHALPTPSFLRPSANYPNSAGGCISFLLEPRLSTTDAALPGTTEGPVCGHGHISGLAKTDQILLGKIRVALNLQRESQLTKKIQTNRTSGNRARINVSALSLRSYMTRACEVTGH